jgi:aryl-alcohol dehydrogenase-like predicted oxidoreductase
MQESLGELARVSQGPRQTATPTLRPVERRSLGRSGLEAGVVGMGTWATLERAGAVGTQSVIDAALDAGTDLFDTSPMYGRAEGLLGAALGSRREEALVATKVWSADDEEARAQIDFSLSCFGGRVDLLQVHNLVAWDERLSELERLRQEGKVRAIGATHYSTSSFGELADVMRSGRVDAVQVPYNPAQREAEPEILPLAEELDIGILVMRPFGEGGLLRRSPPGSELEALGVESWPQALLKWVLSDRRCHAAIPATSRPERAAANAAAGQPPWLDGEQREQVVRLALG